MKRFDYRILGLCAALVGSISGAGCGKDSPIGDALGDLPAKCGLICPGDEDENGVVMKGVLDGNANISGVASVDAFFGAVVKFNAASANVTGIIDAELEGIRADFGLEAGSTADLAADLSAHLEGKLDGGVSGGLKIDYVPAKCQVDAKATLEATAKCDASVDPGKATVKCEGSCKAEAGAEVKCEGGELQCTVTDPSVMCGGSCEGECTAEVSAQGECSGTCEGTCMGECSVKNTDGSCAGECSGQCMGSCKAEVMADGTCMGKCSGSCTAKAPEGGCEANPPSCKAMGSAMVECSGSCDGDFEPPMAKAECQASAKAEASVNVQCTPPQLSLAYKLDASLEGAANAEARAKLVAALKTLVSVRLPKILEASAKAEFVARAGENLLTAATTGVKASVEAAGDAAADGNLKVVVGLGCALGELEKVGMSLDVATSDLTASLSASASVVTELNLGG